MGKELPEMYHNNFNKDIRNNKCVFSTLIKEKKETKEEKEFNNKYDRFNIEQKIFNIFNSKDYIYKADVTIVTDSQTLKKRIIGKNNDNLITMNNEYIPISIIRDIYKN